MQQNVQQNVQREPSDFGPVKPFEWVPCRDGYTAFHQFGNYTVRGDAKSDGTRWTVWASHRRAPVAVIWVPDGSSDRARELAFEDYVEGLRAAFHIANDQAGGTQ